MIEENRPDKLYRGKMISALEYDYCMDMESSWAPLFEFATPGYPRRRKVLYCDLPAKSRAALSALRARFEDECGKVDKHQEPEDVRKIILALEKEILQAQREYEPMEFRAAKSSWEPDWTDYTPEEQKALCRAWHVPLPEPEEVPF